MQALLTRALDKGVFRGLLALVLGSVASCGFQPLALWPLTIIALAGLIEIGARATSKRAAFFTGWLFGVGYFSIGNNWIATAFTFQAEMPAWLGGVAVVLLSFYLAVFPALAMLGAWLFAAHLGKPATDRTDQSHQYSGLFLIPFWILTEWMRGWVFTGYAWNPLGIILLGGYDAQGLAMLSPWIGTYGLSGLTIAIAVLVRHAASQISSSAGPRRIKALVLLGLGIVAVSLTMHRPASYLTREEGGRPFTLIQPNIQQNTINDPQHFESNFLKLAELSVPVTPQNRRIVLWPESGLADYLRDGYPAYLYRLMTHAADPVAARERLGRVIGPYSLLLTGAVDVVIEDGDDIAARNSVTAIDWRGHILASYAKAHLVPYGEYLPMRSVLEPLGMSRLVAGKLDFWAGPGPRTLDFGPWGEAGIQICYEIVFSGEVVDPQNRPDFIFNPSNDGWFGDWGPPQHLAQARLRAIEEGLPVLRSTTNGISAVIDADGIVRDHIPGQVAGRIDGMIPPAHQPTLFARFGNQLPISLALVLLLVSAVALRLRKR